jgi:hypothetical protein
MTDCRHIPGLGRPSPGARGHRPLPPTAHSQRDISHRSACAANRRCGV